MSTTTAAASSVHPMLDTAMQHFRRVAPGRLGLHAQGHRIPHIVDALVLQRGIAVAGVSVIGGSMQEVVSLAAAFRPDILAWTGPATSSKPDAPMRYMTVATQRGSHRTMQSAVNFRRDSIAGEIVMNRESVLVDGGPADVAAALTNAHWVDCDVVGAAQLAHRKQGQLGMLIYGGTSIAAVLADVLHRQGWTKLADGSVVNAGGSATEQRRLVRGLSMLSTSAAFREELAQRS